MFLFFSLVLVAVADIENIKENVKNYNTAGIQRGIAVVNKCKYLFACN